MIEVCECTKCAAAFDYEYGGRVFCGGHVLCPGCASNHEFEKGAEGEQCLNCGNIWEGGMLSNRYCYACLARREAQEEEKYGAGAIDPSWSAERALDSEIG